MFAEKESGWESECGWARKPRDENPSSRDVMPARVIKLKSFVSGVVHRERGGGRGGGRKREREREEGFIRASKRTFGTATKRSFNMPAVRELLYNFVGSSPAA